MLRELKIAVINKDFDKLKELSFQTPEFSSLKEAKEYLAYIKEAIKLLNEEKLKLSKEMAEIRKLKNFYEKENKDILNISYKDVTVFGDSLNDIGMFEYAGTSIAVKNACDEVKKRADIILPHTNDEDAVAQYLKRF